MSRLSITCNLSVGNANAPPLTGLYTVMSVVRDDVVPTCLSLIHTLTHLDVAEHKILHFCAHLIQTCSILDISLLFPVPLLYVGLFCCCTYYNVVN